jgi:hypothetical protein
LLIVASSHIGNAEALGCANVQVTGFRAYLPDCRSYELVTPVYAQGFPAFPIAVSETGSQMLVWSFGSFADLKNMGGVLGQPYELTRTGEGWKPQAIETPFAEHPTYFVEALSPGFQSSLWFASTPKSHSLEVYRGTSGKHLEHLGSAEPSGAMEPALNFVGGSEDLSRTLYFDRESLWPGDTTVSERPSLYEYTGTENKEPRLVGLDAKGTLVSDCGTYLGSGRGAGQGDFYNAVSSSGSTVFFTAPASSTCSAPGPSVTEVYARINGERTVAISEPNSTDCKECQLTNPTDAEFAGASLDGSKVFFTTVQHLLPGMSGAGTELYEYDFEAPAGRRVTLVSHGAVAGADVLGVARVSEDGSHVYFVAGGVLTGVNRENRSPIANAPNLYVAVSECADGAAACVEPVERISFVATLSAVADGRVWSTIDARPVQASPNGRFLAFQSGADLTSDEEGRPEAGQVFKYDAQAETLVRISRSQNGYNEDGNSSTFSAHIPIQEYDAGAPTSRSASPTQRFTHLAISEDGSRVFFSSPIGLTRQALNEVQIDIIEGVPIYAENIYEYEGGKVYLISDGQDTTRVIESSAVELIGTDGSGSDVFFTTADSLVSSDSNTQVDIYDARVDGGFSSRVELAPCLAGSCRGPASELLAPQVPGSTSVSPEAVAGPVVIGSVSNRKVVKTTRAKRKKKHTTRRREDSRRKTTRRR